MEFCPNIAIIVLNWNGYLDTIECLESLYHIFYSNFFIILVDNNSTDDSIENIKNYCSGRFQVTSKFFEYDSTIKPITIYQFMEEDLFKLINRTKWENEHNIKHLFLIRNNKNYGFSAGNNVGIKFALKNFNPDFILLLNNDVVVERSFLTNLVRCAAKENTVCLLGPKILYYDFNGKANIVNFAGGRFNWLKYPGYHHIHDKKEDIPPLNGMQVCDWITGAAFMINVKTSPLILLNEKFFFGCEDIDFCLNLKKQGKKVAICYDSIIWHKIGISRNKRDDDFFKRYFFDAKTNFELLKMHKKTFPLLIILFIPQILFNLLKTKYEFYFNK